MFKTGPGGSLEELLETGVIILVSIVAFFQVLLLYIINYGQAKKYLLNFLALAKFEARLFCLARTLALISFQLKVIIKTSVKLFEKYARSLIPILFTHCPSAAFHFAARSLAWLDPCVDSPLFSQSTIGYLQN